MKPRPWQVVLVIVGGVLAGLLSLALAFIELRLLITGAASLYERPVAQALRYFFRLLGALLVFVNAVAAFFALKSRGPFVTFAITLCFGALLFSCFAFFFYEWYICLGLVLGNLLLLLASTLRLFPSRK